MLKRLHGCPLSRLICWCFLLRSAAATDLGTHANTTETTAKHWFCINRPEQKKIRKTNAQLFFKAKVRRKTINFAAQRGATGSFICWRLHEVGPPSVDRSPLINQVAEKHTSDPRGLCLNLACKSPKLGKHGFPLLPTGSKVWTYSEKAYSFKSTTRPTANNLLFWRASQGARIAERARKLRWKSDNSNKGTLYTPRVHKMLIFSQILLKCW